MSGDSVSRDAEVVESSEVREPSFRKMLMKIVQKLKNNDEVEQIKFMCYFISRARKEKITSTVQLLEEIEYADKLSVDDTEFLKECVGEINRKDLVRIIEEYEQLWLRPNTNVQGSAPVNMTRVSQSRPNRGVIAQEQGPDLTDEFEFLRNHLGRDWRSLARRFRLSETDIDSISHDYVRDLKEQSMQALLLWKQYQGSAANKQMLVATLRKCNLNFLADQLEEMAPHGLESS
ncbi:FAS-associated death domain protein-like [Glandiceps talaboti]